MSGASGWSSELVAAALGVPAPARLSFSGISTDTRKITTDGEGSGSLFVALQGERYDAHAFLGEAKRGGATAAVVRRGTAAVAGLPFFEVEDTLEALGRLAHARRLRLPQGSPVIAITGSSGKTSTKEMIRAALATRYRVHATTGNLNNRVGVPLTILSAPDDTNALVVEAGASLPGEIALLRDIIAPTVSVITNVGHAHLEGFGSLEGVMREKLALAEGVPVAIVGTEPPTLAQEARRRTRTVVAGAGPGAEVHPHAAELDDAGHAVIRWMGARVSLPVVGFHQIDNAMLAVAAAREAGIAPAEALAALSGVTLPGGRGAVRQIGDLTVLDDTYNANPSSLRRAVELASWLARRRGRPLAVVVGTMLELGPESDKLHAAAAADIVAREPAVIGAVGAFEAAFEPYRERLGDRLVVARDAEELGPKLAAILQGHEVVLFKASRGVALERALRHLT
ncbi:MAG TPA: UDP-N-acetylmuramoyl-tripeptide--D-alanyl-D-alanine ligase [Gemmatimonadales bacterium]|nr:UDP-N-acetylmuramoyl-tripeptide--D-alanyl-D-alanine ligase [Gemmatimonadales bacterium]